MSTEPLAKGIERVGVLVVIVACLSVAVYVIVGGIDVWSIMVVLLLAGSATVLTTRLHSAPSVWLVVISLFAASGLVLPFVFGNPIDSIPMEGLILAVLVLAFHQFRRRTRTGPWRP